MPRVLWKGAISFGLVHIPVSLYPASKDDDIDFDWLDRRSMEPVGYRRINKATGKAIASEDIVRGVELDKGEYVVVDDDEIQAAYPRATQTIEIEAFVSAEQIPFVQLERPYYLEPAERGEKVYALLREALLERQRVGVARLVMSRKQHLAALVPSGRGLLLNTLRWAAEIRPWTELKLPPEGRGGLKEREFEMATQLIDELTTDWQPEAYRDSFKERIMDLVERKSKAGQTESVEPVEAAEAAPKSADIVDLTELLKKSLKRPRDETPKPAKGAPRRKRA